VAKLLSSNIEIVYKPENENIGVNALSRSVEEPKLKSVMIMFDYLALVIEVHEKYKWKRVIERLQ